MLRVTETERHRNRWTRHISLWAPVVLYMAAIFYVSSLSQPPQPPGGDKPWHLLAYLGLGILVVRAVAGGVPAGIHLSTALKAVAIAVAYAASDELHQWFVPGRSASMMDLVADAIGVCAGTAACWAWAIISVSRDDL
jgi:VanZ family protein